MAEALLVHEGGARFDAASAGATPATFVDPMTFEVLDDLGIDWRVHRPKGFDAVQDTVWDLVVTVCDRAREVCPVLPGQPMYAHWSLEDPEDQFGTPGQRRQYFLRSARLVHACIRELVALETSEWREERIAACFHTTNAAGTRLQSGGREDTGAAPEKLS